MLFLKLILKLQFGFMLLSSPMKSHSKCNVWEILQHVLYGGTVIKLEMHLKRNSTGQHLVSNVLQF